MRCNRPISPKTLLSGVLFAVLLSGSQAPGAEDKAAGAAQTLHDTWSLPGILGGGVKTNDAYVDGSFFLTVPAYSSIGRDGWLAGDVIFLEPYSSWGEQGEVAVSLGLGWRHLFSLDPVKKARYLATEPGIYLREARWLSQFRPALVGSDSWALEVLPAPAPWSAEQFYPVHQELLTHHGIRIGEGFNSEELAADEVYEFVFFYTGQRGKGATAANVAPGALGQSLKGAP